jgi:trans-aconitate methyltransferase
VTQAPDRILWAVELLALRPADRVLEIGSGPGVAAWLVAARLTDGSMTAIDRSPTAIARAHARNADHLESGRLTLQQSTLAEFRSEQPFDKAFAVNVNVFWTTPAGLECSALRAALVPAGVVHLVYGGPGGDTRSDAIERVAANLGGGGFTTTVRDGPRRGLVCVTGRLA